MLRRDRELQYCFYVVACTGSAVFVLVAKHAAEQITAFQGARPVAAQFVSRLYVLFPSHPRFSLCRSSDLQITIVDVTPIGINLPVPICEYT